MDNNFSAQVKDIFSFIWEEALRLGIDFIGTEHLLLGLIREGDNTAVRILKSFNVDLYELRKEVELAVKDKTGKNICKYQQPSTHQTGGESDPCYGVGSKGFKKPDGGNGASHAFDSKEQRKHSNSNFKSV